ncbi:MAG: hypothetical protein IPK10_13025 [Bacteroidetes bacterium]|nr:hypothetical protein [Bacteroidota bacterium]
MITPAMGCTTLVVNGYFTQSGDCNSNENLVQIKFAGFDSLNVYFGPDSLMDSVCVLVTNACIDPNTIVLKDSSYSSSLSAMYSNTSFYVEGLFTVNSNLTLNNCDVFMAAGAQIIIASNIMFSLDSATSIIGCDTMWQGILMEQGAELRY